MEFAVTYGVAEALLVGVYDVPEARWDAFRARLRLFKRLGFPHGVNTGRGKHAPYGAAEITSLALAVELLKVTQTSEQAVELVRDHQDLFRAAVRRALEIGLTEESVFLLISPSSPWGVASTARLAASHEMSAELARGQTHCTVSVDLSRLILSLIRRLFLLLEGAETAFRRDLNQWAMGLREGGGVD